MAPLTDFAVSEKYSYLEGLQSYHQSEAIAGANPRVNNHPQNPPYGLRTERLSGTSFTAPREQTLHTWMYRSVISLEHSTYSLLEPAPTAPNRFSPNSYTWPTFSLPPCDNADWTKQTLLAGNGDPATKTGVAIWLFKAEVDMPEQTAFSSLDGDCLIIPQFGALDIQTELGRLLVRQNEIAMIPRGVRYRVTLPSGSAHGYIIELFQGHFQLPSLGAIGTTGLANIRDFQVPKACFDGDLRDGVAVSWPTAKEWHIIARQQRALWSCQQSHTPFDVAGWHGTNYPFKFDLAKFCVLDNALFDDHDPSLYTVLLAPGYRELGHNAVEVGIVPQRWKVSENSMWLPYCHRNTSVEFTAPIINAQSPDHHLNKTCRDKGFAPFGAVINNPMTVHGIVTEGIDKAKEQSTAPSKVQTEGVTIVLIETELPLMLTEWAEESVSKNFKEGFRGFQERKTWE